MQTDRPTTATTGDAAKDQGVNAPQRPAPEAAKEPAKEIGGAAGPDPTRYGDWERKGRCIDF